MELAIADEPAKTIRTGHEVVTLEPGDRYQIRTGRAGEITILLDYEAPDVGKITVSQHTTIEETDA